MIVYITAENSDDRLSQHEWSVLIRNVDERVRHAALAVTGYWHSAPDSPLQNACWCAELPDSREGSGWFAKKRNLWNELAHEVLRHGLECIRWDEAGARKLVLPQDEGERKAP